MVRRQIRLACGFAVLDQRSHRADRGREASSGAGRRRRLDVDRGDRDHRDHPLTVGVRYPSDRADRAHGGDRCRTRLRCTAHRAGHPGRVLRRRGEAVRLRRRGRPDRDRQFARRGHRGGRDAAGDQAAHRRRRGHHRSQRADRQGHQPLEGLGARGCRRPGSVRSRHRDGQRDAGSGRPRVLRVAAVARHPARRTVVARRHQPRARRDHGAHGDAYPAGQAVRGGTCVACPHHPRAGT